MPRHISTPYDATHGLEAIEARLHRRIGTSPIVTKERLLANLPHVQAASRRLQNATGVYNKEAWPTPSKLASEVDQITYEANVAALHDAIKECANFCVDMKRGSERGEVLDGVVEGLEKRLVKTKLEDEKVQENDKIVKDKGKGKEKEVTDITVVEQDKFGVSVRDKQVSEADRSPVTAGVQEAGSEARDFAEVAQTNSIEKLSVPPTSSITLSAMQNATGAVAVDNGWQAGIMRMDTDSNLSGSSLGDQSMAVNKVSRDHSPRQYPPFPDPQNMAGSFTDAVCQYDEFTVKPILALTLKDVTPLMHLPGNERCVLLKHFEVGLDGVEAIVAGEVVIPESPFWKKNIRENRLGKLGTLKTGRGGYSKELEDHQRRCRHGEGRWMFFGIKFMQSHKQMKKGQGKWGCFGAPLEAVQRFDAVEEEVCLGGENDVPAHTERFLRTNVKLSAGGVPCIDLWEGAKDWDDGVWVDVLSAMANTCLVVNTLYQTKEQKNAASADLSSSMRCSNSVNKMNDSTEVQLTRKRNHSAVEVCPRQGNCDKKTKSKPLIQENEVELIQ